MTGPASDTPGTPAPSPNPATASPAEHGGRRSGRPSLRLFLISGGVIVLALVVLLFFVGLRLGESTASDGSANGSSAADSSSAGATASPTPSATPTATPQPDTADAAPPGPLAPGVHAWDALHGGECLTGYSSPWAEVFTVVDCAETHTAQLVTVGAFAEDAGAGYPGEAELTSRLNLLCTAPAALDYAAAEAFADLQWQASYPADEAEWTAGARSYSCFFSRSSGEPLAGSLATAPAG